MGKFWFWALVILMLVAFWLRLPGLFGNTFHADEALFASWARQIAVWRDPLLAGQPVDKPPLLFYAMALFYPLQGAVMWAARLPNWLASLMLVPLTAVCFWRLYGWRAGGMAAAVVVAGAPLAVQFSATAFTDPLLLFWLMGGLTLAVGQPGQRRPGWAGVCLGLALATKYQAVLFLPLLLGVGWLMGYGRRQWGRLVAGVLVVGTAVLLWEVARTGGFTLWNAQAQNYGGVRLIWAWELGPRLMAWGELGQTAVSGALFILLGLAWLVVLWHGWRTNDAHGRLDLLLTLFVAGYGLLHWLTAVPVWDRYLLLLLPLAALLLGRGLMLLTASRLPMPDDRLLLLLLVGVLLLPAWGARNGRYPLGSSPTADGGAAEIAAHLADAPYGTVLYDHWYSWQWRYHLFDKRVYVSWFPDGAALADELAVFGRDGQPRYLVLPQTAVAQPIVRAVTEAGFTLQPVANADTITLYQLLSAEETP
jgi:4-amino-4-deoxy-L-arabinose transferase-like glycosyltransferase